MKYFYTLRHNDMKSSVIKVSVLTIFLLSIWMIAGTVLQAQPVINSYSPSRNAASATQSANVVLGWNTNMNALVGGVSGTNATIIIRGSQTGAYYSVGATITGGGTNTATVNPESNFKAGELITVTVTGATSTGNVPMGLPQVYQFRAKAPTLAGLFTGTGTATVGTWPRRVSLGDVTGDGHLDIIAYSAGDNSAVGSGTIQIQVNNGSGSFTAGQFITGLNGSRSGEIGDVDGDGDLDIVVTSHSNNSLMVLQNNGTGNFTTLSTLALGVQAGYPLLFDADGDGDLDVVMTAGTDLLVRLNDGAGTFSGSYSVSFGGSGPWMITFGDIDNDGDIDVVVPRFANSDAVFMLNNGNGTFTNGGSVGVGNEPLGAALGDIDGDGDLDLVVANGGSSNSVSVRINNGSGSFSGSTQVSVGSGTHFVNLADMDGNGMLDILTANYSDGTVSVRYNNGGVFSGTQNVSMSGAGSIVSVEAGDIDGDGDLDFVTGAVNTNVVGIRFNNPRPVPVVTGVSPTRHNKSVLRDANVSLTFNESVTGVTSGNVVIRGSQTGALYSAAATISGNGTTTIAFDPTANFKVGEMITVTVTNAATALIQPMLTSHTYSFVAKTEVGPMVFTSTNTAVGSSPQSVAVGDLDGDGDLDFVVANHVGFNLSVRLNNGNGTFTDGANLGSSNSLSCVALGDVNNDGHLDVVASVVGGNSVNIFINNGNGTFAGAATYNVGSTSAPAWVALADFDGDKDLDIVTANYATNTNTISVLYNNGNGTYTFSNYVSLNTGEKPFAVTVGDVDNDGDVDILTANDFGNNVSVFYNNGYGSFLSRVNVPVGNGANAVQLADIDGDGDADMLTSDRNANTVSVLFNNGAGTFSGLTTVAVGTTPRTLVTGDFDGDGDLDAAVANNGSNSISLLTNNGSGVFTVHSTISTPSQPYGLAVGDIDGNGSLDMVTTNFANASSTVLLNKFAPPTVTSISPSSGVPGDVVTITGTDFTGATSVTIGGQPVYSFWVSSATTISAVVGSGNSGSIEVRTTTGTAVSASSFTVNSGGVSSQAADVSRIALGQTSFTGTASGQSSSNLLQPFGVAVDPTTGKVFVSDELNNRVLRYASAQQLSNGAAAEAVLGQPDFATVSAGTTAAKMSRPRGIFVDGGGRLWVAENDNNRVLRFDNASSISSGASANGVLGQPNFTSAGFGEAANQFRQPSGVFADGGGRLWVADRGNNRVLRFDNVVAKSNGGNADGLLGQAGFGLSSNLTTRSGMWAPTSVWVDGAGRLWVGEEGNRRVLRFDNAANKANSADADGVLGRAGYIVNTAFTSVSGMSSVFGVSVDGSGRLWVSDAGNNRVLWFDNVAAKSNGADADGVIGQTNFTTGTPSTIVLPRSVFANRDGLLWIVEQDAHRVIAREYVPAPVVSSFTPTSGVAGSTVTISGSNFNEIIGVKIGGQPVYSFWVSSATTISAVVGSGVTGTIEVIARAKSGTSAGQFTVNSGGVSSQPADFSRIVLGQTSFTGTVSGQSSSNLLHPFGVAVDPTTGKVFVSDELNNRVLRYASAQQLSNGAAAEAVLGQPDFATVSAGTTAAKMSRPRGIFVDGGGRLWVAENDNNRVLRFDNASSISSGASANGVLGQPNFTSAGSGAAANQQRQPAGVFVDGGGRLWVADLLNRRVLRYDNAALKANGANADGLLGQIDFGFSDNLTTRSGMWTPTSVWVDGAGRLWVGEEGNKRVVRFDNAANKAKGADADGVLGKADYVTNTLQTTQSGMSSVFGVTVDGSGRLWVSDADNNRVLWFDNAALKANGANADGVIGQSNYTTGGALQLPRSVFANRDGLLWIVEHNAHRVIAREYLAVLPPTISNVVATTGTWSDGNILSTTGHSLTITGTNLGELTAVRFFGESGVTGIVSSSNATQVVVQVPSGISVTSGSIRVTNIAGSFTTTAVVALVAPPSISNVSPLSVAVGDTLTVSGQNLQYVTTARIFGVSGIAGVISSRSATQLRVVVPAGTASQGNVYVENIAGSNSGSQQITVVQSPVISGITSTGGVWSDGNILSTTGHSLTLTGTNLGELTAVRFFGESGVTGIVSSSNATQVVVQVPSGISVTSGSIRVTNIAGSFTTTAVVALVAPPSISNVSPLSVAVGDTLTVSGQNLQYVTTARIFGVSGIAGVISSRSATQLRVVVPAGTASQGNVYVENIAGSSSGSQQITVVQSPVISGITSTGGVWSDGNILSTTGHSLTLTGTNLGELTAVRFFGESGVTGIVSSSNATQVVVQVPSGISVTSGSIRITNIAGSFTTTAVVALVAPPSISNVSPLSVAVGDTLTVSGQNLQYVTTARIFGVSGIAGVISSRSATQLRVVVPAGTASQGNVYVENIAGSSSGSQQITVVQSPVISGITSTGGVWSDGNILSTTGHSLTLTGTNLGELTAVLFFGVRSGVTGIVSSSNATQVVVQVPSEISVTSGSIRVTNIAGSFTTTAVVALVAPPSISNVSPLSVAVGDTLTVSGQNLQYVTTARIFGVSGIAGVISSRSATQLRVVVPAGTASQGNVYVENIAGSSSGSQQIKVVQSPVISGITSTGGVWSDGNILSTTGHSLTLTGTNLGELTAVRFFGESGVTGIVSSSNATQVVVQVPSGISVTSGSIRITNIAGSFSTTAVVALVAAPSISNVSPLFTQRGGLLTINGDNLQYIHTAKTFGVNGASAQIQSRSRSEISILIPSNSLSQGFVYLENIAGTTLASQSVNVVDFPVLTGVTPVRSHTGGTVQLTGFNLQFLSEVRFFGNGGIEGEIISTSSTVVTVRVPSSVSAASGRVFIRNISGTTQAPSDIEIVFPPVISSVSAVKTATGQTLTITGQHLQYIEQVRFFGAGGVLASVQSSSATQLVVTVPAGISVTSGTIFVQNIGGNTLSPTVEIVSLPSVQQIVVTPQYSGAIVADPQTSTPLIVTGGIITLQGNNLADVTAVRFFGNSGVAGTITSKSATNLVVQVPSNITTGNGQLWVENLAGGALATPTVAIMRQPIITSVSPILTATGQTVTISGQDLAYSTDVRFFGEAGVAGRIISTSATVLQVAIPSSASAVSGQVWLRNAAGTALSAQTVELIQLPNIVSVSTLITGTGATFTISGTNLGNISEVRFFGMSGVLASVQSSSATQLVVTVPAGISQASGVIFVRNLAGGAVSPQEITLVSPPVISNVEPTLVAVGGLITIQGEHLQNLSAVRFFGASGVAGAIQSNTATRATITVPAGITSATGQVYISGQGGNTLSAQEIEIFLPPSITAVSILRTTTGATLTLTGTSLNRLTEVRFFGVGGALALVQSSSATQVIVTVPAGITSPSGRIYVANAVGNTESPQIVTIIQPPSISGITPLLTATGANITVTGQHLDDITQARFFAIGGITAVVVSSSATQIILTVPSGLQQSKGAIVVSNISGTAVSGQEVEIVAPPVLGTPNKLRVAAGDTIIFNGSNLANITSVRFFGAGGTVAELLSASATSISVRVPGGIVGNSGFVWAENIAGNTTSLQQIEIIRQPVISTVTPALTTTGATITITGEHLQYITSVEFIATNTIATNVVGSSNATQIAVQVPAGLIGATAQIRLRNIGGMAESTPITLVRPPVITSVTPNTSRVGYIITLAGDNLQHLNTVRFFGATGVAGQVLSSSATQAVVKVPSGITVTSGNIYVENIAGNTLSPETIIQLPLPLLVYWSNGTSVAHGDINTPTNISPNFIGGLQSPRGLFVDVVNGYIYWADEGNNRIGRANIDGNNRQDNFVTGISSPRDVFVNNQLGYIYWINGGTNTIGRAQLSNIASTIQANFITSIGTPSAMAYDGGYFYVSDASGNSIRRAEVTGGAATVFIPAAQTGFNPQGVTVQSGLLYWCTPNEGIRRRAVSGGTVETIVPFAQLGSTAAQGVTVFDGKVYWADVPGGRIRRANVDGSAVETIFNGVGSPRFPHIGRDISSTPPMISSFTPTTAWAGAQVVINGVSFKNQSHVLSVRFGGEEAQYVVSSDTQITATVGAGATGTVSVQTLAGGASLAGFTFLAPPAITSVAPLEAAVGMPITITGTNLNLVTAVRFFGNNGVQTASFVQQTPTQLVVNVPSGASGQGFIAVVAQSGTALATQAVRLLERPSVTGLSPLRTTTGGTITISGSNLDRVQQVRFFGNSGVLAMVQSSSASQVTVTVPAGIAVPSGAIFVANIAGNTVATQTVSLIQPPVITALSTTETIVGDTVILSGTEIEEISAVRFFGSNGIVASFSVTNGQVRAVVPAGTAGTQGRIHITNPAGSVLSESISVLAAPSVVGVTPTITKAADTIRLSGTHLGAVNSVRFFGNSGTEAVITQRTNTFVDVIVPSSATGSQGQIFVANRAGNILVPSLVTVVAPPQITSVTPAFAEINDTLTITGAHLGNIQTVRLFGSAGTIVTPLTLSPNQIKLLVPRSVAGTSGRVFVQNIAGNTLATDSTVVASPLQITAISPTLLVTGNTVTLQGTGLNRLTTVRLFGNNGIIAPIQSKNSTQAIITVPSGITQRFGQLFATDGIDEISPATVLEVLMPPVVNSVNTSITAREQTLTLAGDNLQHITEVRFFGASGVVATIISQNNQQLTVRVPNASSGAGAIFVRNAAGTALSPTVTILERPSIQNVSPLLTVQGASVNLTGEHFAHVDTVRFFGATGVSALITSKTATSLTVTVPSGVTPIIGNIYVRNLAGSTTSEQQVEIVNQPVITSVTPTTVVTGGSLTILGNNLQHVTTVRFFGAGGAEAVIAGKTATSLTVTVPSGITVASGNVYIANLAGNTVSGQLVTIARLPNITNVSPVLSVTGGSVVLQGEHLQFIDTVRFFGASGVVGFIQQKSAQSLTVTVPSGISQRSGNIVATGIAGTALAPASIEIVAPPMLNNVSSLLVKRGDTITLSGTNLRHIQRVRFFGNAGAEATIVLTTDTTLRCIVPNNHIGRNGVLVAENIAGTAQTQQTVEVVLPPVVQSVSAVLTTIGATLTITGNELQHVDTVRFFGAGGALATISSRTATQLVVTVPTQISSTSGQLYVANLAGSSLTPQAIEVVRQPVLTGVSATRVAAGNTLILQGQELQQITNVRFFGASGVAATIVSKNNTQLSVLVPNNASVRSGRVWVSNLAGNAETPQTIDIVSTPTISAISSTLTFTGATITISGNELQQVDTVRFFGTTGVPAVISAQTQTSLTVTVPSGITARSGAIRISNVAGAAIAGQITEIVSSPVVNSVSRTLTATGATLTFYGRELQHVDTIRFFGTTGIAATIINKNADSLSVTVPTGIATRQGTVYIANIAGNTVSPNIEIARLPVINSVSETLTVSGATISLSGDELQHVDTVRFFGSTGAMATISTKTQNSLTVLVPHTATSRSGGIYVANNAGGSLSPLVEIARQPIITGVSAVRTITGATISLSGDELQHIDTVRFFGSSGVIATITGKTQTGLTITVPAGINSRQGQIVVRSRAGTALSPNIAIVSQPVITSVTPASVQQGGIVEILGQNLEAIDTVRFFGNNGTATDIIEQTSTLLRVKVPILPSDTVGFVFVKNIAGTALASQSISITPAPLALYWSNRTAQTIGRVPMNNPQLASQNFINGTGTAQGLAVDMVRGYIYWAQGDTAIGRANLDGTGVQTSFIGGLQSVRSVAVDAQNSILYWGTAQGALGKAQVQATSATNVNHSFATNLGNIGSIAIGGNDIFVADYNVNVIRRVAGSNGAASVAVQTATTGLLLRGIAVHQDQLYWYSQTGIRRSTLTGANAVTIVPAATLAGNSVEHIAVFGNRLYWGEINSQRIRTIPLSGGNITTFADNIPAPYNIVIGSNPALPAPTISGFTPTATWQGGEVVITGTGFRNQVNTYAVQFGDIAASSFTVESDTRIRAVVATGATGSVEVQTLGGSARADGFTFVPGPSVTSVSAERTVTGATLTITGNNLQYINAARFFGTTGVQGTLGQQTTTAVQVIVPSGITTQSGSIVLSGNNGTAQTQTVEIVALPLISSVSTTLTQAGANITLFGTNLQYINAVRFFGTSGTPTTVISSTATMLQVVVPSGLGAASGRIAVSNIAGTALSPTDVEIAVLPVISTLSETLRTTGETLTLTGSNLTHISSVRLFGANGTPAQFTVVSPTQITVTVPAGITQRQGTVYVQNFVGGIESSQIVRLVQQPIITGVQPSSALPGAAITLNGDDFERVDQVRFFGSNGVEATILNKTRNTLQVSVPFGTTADRGRIYVRNSIGEALSPQDFRIILPPTISSIEPLRAPVGTTINIIGVNLADVNLVRFFGVNGVLASIVSASRDTIRVQVPAGVVADSGLLHLTNSAGSTSATQVFTVIRPPVIDSIVPVSNVVGGNISLFGNNFTDVTEVRFFGADGVVAQIVGRTATRLDVIVPSGIAQEVGSIRVINPAGFANSPQFRLILVPAITGITPAIAAPGETITITGQRLADITSVRFFGASGVEGTIVSSSLTQLRVIVPQGIQAASGFIRVANLAGATNAPMEFSLMPQSVVTGITPASGLPGSVVTISGQNLQYIDTVRFFGTGGTIAEIISKNATTLQVRVPGASSAETGNIALRSLVSTVQTTPFRVILQPIITAIEPLRAPVNALVTIRGRRFLDHSAVRFFGQSVATVVSFTDSTIQVRVPSAQANSGTIQVVNPAGTATGQQTFTIIRQPVITSVAPIIAPVGDTITISGDHLADVTEVRFFGTQGVTSAIISQTATVLRVRVPAGTSTFSGSIALINSAGQALTPFTIMRPPVVTGITPLRGVANNRVTITGTNFADVTEVRFFGPNGSLATIEERQPNSIRVIVPAQPAGQTSGAIFLRNKAGNTVSTQLFTYIQRAVITAITPADASPGEIITLTGQFEAISEVRFMSSIGPIFQIVSATATELRLRVPSSNENAVGRIFVFNPAGVTQSATNFTITLPTPPPAPTTPAWENIADFAMTATWSHPGGRFPAVTYQVAIFELAFVSGRWQAVNVGQVIVQNTGAAKQSHTFTNLKQGVNYYFGVRGWNNVGFGAILYSAWGKTLDSRPGVPFSPAINQTTPTSVKVKWVNVSVGGTPQLFRAQVFRNGVLPTGTPVREVTVNVPSDSIVVTGLLEDTDYYYRIRAENSFGTSAWVQSAVFRTERDMRRADSLALITLYSTMGGNSWTQRTNWLSNRPIQEWFGVTVENNRVVEIVLPLNNLQGTIPANWGERELTELRRLILWGNRIGGSTPASMRNWTKLNAVELDNNQFNGFATDLTNLRALRILRMDNNQLNAFPPQLLQMTTNDLRVIRLDRNRISSIASRIENFPQLRGLWLNKNGMTGTLMGNFTTRMPLLESVFLNGNQLTDVPDVKGIQSLRQVLIQNNKLASAALGRNAPLTGRNVVNYISLPQNTLVKKVITVYSGDNVPLVPNDPDVVFGYKWYYNDTLIADIPPGEDGSHWIVNVGGKNSTGAGEYRCEMYVPEFNKMMFTSDIVEVMTLDNGKEPISDSKGTSLVFYPNPADNVVTVEFTAASAEPTVLEVFDASGKVVLQTTLAGRAPGRQTTQLEVQHLPIGSYRLVIRNGGEQMQQTSFIIMR